MITSNLSGYTRTAWLSDDLAYRYLLRRHWQGNEDRGVLFVCLNPSTADHETDDATLRKCVGYAHRWGYGSVEVVNLFAWRSRHPKDLAVHWERSVGNPRNDEQIEVSAQANRLVIAAWGANETMGRDQTVLKILRRVGDVYCLRTTGKGKPEHPLYLPADLTPTLFARKAKP